MTFGGGDHTPRWWAGIICSVGFFLIGVAFLPGLVSRAPTSAPRAEAPPVAETRPAAFAEPDLRDAPAGNLAPPPFSGSAQSAHSAAPHTFDCMIAPNEMLDIGSSITAVIESISVERSSYVEAGQVVARLESRVEEAAVRVAQVRADRTVEIDSTRASLKLGNKRRSRAVDLYEEGSLSLDIREEVETSATLAALSVEEAKENHRLAALQLEQAQAALERRTIRSPIAGFVVERLMAPGEVVDDETILRIAQIDPLRVDVILPTYLFGAVRPGDPVEIVPEPPLDQVRTAELHIVDRIIDGASGTFGVTLLLPNPDHDLPGGLRCQARIVPRDREAEVASADAAAFAPPADDVGQAPTDDEP